MNGLIRNIVLILSIFLAAGTRAESIDSLFAHSRAAEVQLLKLGARLDLLDLYNCGMAAHAENDFGGTTRMIKKAENHVLLQLTEVSRWELKRLPAATDTLLCSIHTIETEGGASRIRFYNTAWKEVKMQVPQPAFDDFWQPADSLPQERQETLRKQLLTSGITARWSATEPTLTLNISTATLNKEGRKDAEHCLRPIRFRYENGIFIKE